MHRICAFLLMLAVGFTSTSFVRKVTPENTQEILGFVSHYLPENPVVIEAGGFNGGDTVQMAQKWPNGRVFSFEPVPELFMQLSERTRAFPNVTCFAKALSDQTGSSSFYLSEWGGRVAGSSSLLPPKEHLVCDPSVTFPAVITVETMTLDDWAAQQGISNIDFMWLDMQGFELNMLKASRLALNASVIFMEVEFVEAYAGQYVYEDIFSWMRDHGFHLLATDFDEKHIEEEIASHRFWGNAIFARDR